MLPAVNNIDALNVKVLGAPVGTRIQKILTINHFKGEKGNEAYQKRSAQKLAGEFCFKCTANSDDLCPVIEI